MAAVVPTPLASRPPLASRRLATPAWPRCAAASLARAAAQRWLLEPTLRLVCRPLQVEGAGALAAIDGPVLLVANHSSHLDAVVLLAALPSSFRRRVAVAAAEDYFYRSAMLGAAVSLLLGTFPFPRQAGCGFGLARAAALLETGWSVLLFPEGTRSPDGTIQEFRRGAARLLLRTGVPVVTAGIRGTHAVLPRGAWLPRPGSVGVRFGEAWRPPPGMDVDALTARLVGEITRPST